LPISLHNEEAVEKFRKILTVPLPPCFRLNAAIPNYKIIEQKIIDQSLKVDSGFSLADLA
jgi:hypothetical protein